MKVSEKLRKKMAALPVGSVYDTNGHLVSHKCSDGTWDKYKRDGNGKLVSHKCSNGSWKKWKRYYHWHHVSYKCSNGYWKEWKRDTNGKVIATTSSND